MLIVVRMNLVEYSPGVLCLLVYCFSGATNPADCSLKIVNVLFQSDGVLRNGFLP